MEKEIELIWNDFHKELKNFIKRKGVNAADADDILQNAFLKIIKNIDKINEAKNLRQYLYGIVRNSTIDYFRNQKFDKLEMIEQTTFGEAENQALNSTIADCCIKPFIQKLPDKYREALRITEFENSSQKELAKQLNISYSGAKSRVQRGKEKLKQLILDCCILKTDSYGNILPDDSDYCSCP